MMFPNKHVNVVEIEDTAKPSGLATLELSRLWCEPFDGKLAEIPVFFA
jgi:hypothetical protein